jgi:hypothetical protein
MMLDAHDADATQIEPPHQDGASEIQAPPASKSAFRRVVGLLRSMWEPAPEQSEEEQQSRAW